MNIIFLTHVQICPVRNSKVSSFVQICPDFTGQNWKNLDRTKLDSSHTLPRPNDLYRLHSKKVGRCSTLPIDGFPNELINYKGLKPSYLRDSIKDRKVSYLFWMSEEEGSKKVGHCPTLPFNVFPYN